MGVAWMLVGAALGAVVLARQAVPPTREIPAASPNAAANVRFADVTVESGLSGFRHVSGGAEKNYIIEATGSGFRSNISVSISVVVLVRGYSLMS